MSELDTIDMTEGESLSALNRRPTVLRAMKLPSAFTTFEMHLRVPATGRSMTQFRLQRRLGCSGRHNA